MNQCEKEKSLINENLSKKPLKPPLAGDKPGFDMMYSAVRGESERWESNRYIYADGWMENQVLVLLHETGRSNEEQQE